MSQVQSIRDRCLENPIAVVFCVKIRFPPHASVLMGTQHVRGQTLLGSSYNFIIHTRAYNDLLWRLHVFFVVLIFLLLCCGVESLLD